MSSRPCLIRGGHTSHCLDRKRHPVPPGIAIVFQTVLDFPGRNGRNSLFQFLPQGSTICSAEYMPARCLLKRKTGLSSNLFAALRGDHLISTVHKFHMPRPVIVALQLNPDPPAETRPAPKSRHFPLQSIERHRRRIRAGGCELPEARASEAPEFRDQTTQNTASYQLRGAGPHGLSLRLPQYSPCGRRSLDPCR